MIPTGLPDLSKSSRVQKKLRKSKLFRGKIQTKNGKITYFERSPPSPKHMKVQTPLPLFSPPCPPPPKKLKTIGFIVFSLTHVSKTSVLSTLRSKTLINCFQFHTFCKTCSTFTENPCAKMQKKTQKSEEQNISYMKNCKKKHF